MAQKCVSSSRARLVLSPIRGRSTFKLTKAFRVSESFGAKPLQTRPFTNSEAKHSRFYRPIVLAFLSGSLLSGFLGYTLGKDPSPKGTPEHHDYLESPIYGSPQEFDKGISELRDVFSCRNIISTDPEVLEIHGFSTMNSRHPGRPHSVVVFVESTEDIVEVVKVANKYKMPVVAYSGGTSLEGHFVAHPVGGICVDLSEMNEILQINEADSDIVVQAGCQWQDINSTLQEKGIPLFFPLDPAPGATIGGMIATGCSGTNAVRYGTAKGEWFLNVTVVLPSGEVIKTRRRARKSSTGFDTTKLFIGAEGSLGIVTEATLRLAPVLDTTVAVVQFPDVRRATEAVREIINRGISIQCVELVDDKFMHATNRFGASIRKWPEKDSLFIKLQGPSSNAIKETSKAVKTITERHGGTGYELAHSPEEAADLWSDRKNAHFSTIALLPGCYSWPTDVWYVKTSEEYMLECASEIGVFSVPVSALPELVYETKKDLEANGILATMVGHVGDGNFHAQMIFDGEDKDALKRVHEASDRMVKRALALDGTCSGEHGIGLGKRKYLNEELGPGTVEVMKTVKRALDPYNLFNPGKLYPDAMKHEMTQPDL